MIRFNAVTGIDAYCATLDATEGQILSHLQARDLAPLYKRERGMHSYEASLVCELSPGEQVARILYGGRNGKPHVQAFGGHAEAVAEMIREIWPDAHDVTRIDICRDYDEPGFFDRWYPVMVEIARAANICTPCAGEWHQDPKSRTQYIGSPKSQVRVRCYEKGAQLRNEFKNIPHLAAAIPEAWTRVEAQIKPNHALSRQMCATANPADLWGVSPALRAIVAQIEGLEPQRVSLCPTRPPSAAQQACAHMFKQYKKSLKALDREIGRTAIISLFEDHLDF